MARRLLAALLTFLISSAGAAAPALAAEHPSTSLQSLVAAIGGNPSQAGSARYAYLGKLDGTMQHFAAGEGASGGPLSAAGPEIVPGEGALVDVYVGGDLGAAARELRQTGMTVTAVSRSAPERMVEGYLPSG